MAQVEKKQSFFQNFVNYIAGKLPYQQIDYNRQIDQINPKFKVFIQNQTRRQDALRRQSVSQSFKQAATAAGVQNAHGNLLYANVQEDKHNRLADYRIMAAYSTVANALDEICDQTINIDDQGECIKLKIRNLDLKEIGESDLQREFQTFVEHFKFEERGWDYFRTLLTIGELYWENVIHEQYPQYGILGVLPIPAELIDPIYSNSQILEPEGYLLRKPVFSANDPTKIDRYDLIPLHNNQITYVHSGIWDANTTYRLPFIENARRAYRQLSLIEDAIVIYRLVRAPERLVFNVDTGTLPPADAEKYLRRLMQNYWSSKTFDIGQSSTVTKFNPQSMLEAFWFAKRAGSEGTKVEQLPGGCLAMDTKVPLLDGRELSIKEISEEIKNYPEKEIWCYSAHPITGEIKPGIISWAGVTQESAKVMKITLDNGKSLICTYDHKFPIQGKGFVRADELVVGQSMMPFYTKDITITSIEFLPDEIQVGTLTIDKEEKYHNYHTFALCCGIFTKNSNLGQLEDLYYFQRELYEALHVPAVRLNPEATVNDGQDILRQELKFANFIIRLQQRMASGIKKAFITHLMLTEKWQKYGLSENHIHIKFNPPTNYYELRENQRLELKVNNFNSLISNDLISTTFAQKKYLGWSDRDILANREFLRKDREFLWELDQIASGGKNWRNQNIDMTNDGGESIPSFGDSGSLPISTGGSETEEGSPESLSGSGDTTPPETGGEGATPTETPPSSGT